MLLFVAWGAYALLRDSVRIVFVRELHTKFLLQLGSETIDVTTASAGTATFFDRARGQLLVSAAMLPEGARSCCARALG